MTDLLAGSGIDVNDGVLVDEHCRASVEGVFAAGDVANHYHPVFGRRIRTEHWNNAREQGRAAALNMMGRDVPYDEIHWFWSDQYEHTIQYAGYHREWDELVIRGAWRLGTSRRSTCSRVGCSPWSRSIALGRPRRDAVDPGGRPGRSGRAPRRVRRPASLG